MFLSVLKRTSDANRPDGGGVMSSSDVPDFALILLSFLPVGTRTSDGEVCVGRCFQERRSAMDGGRRSSYRDVLVRGPENSLRHARLACTAHRSSCVYVSNEGGQ